MKNNKRDNKKKQNKINVCAKDKMRRILTREAKGGGENMFS